MQSLFQLLSFKALYFIILPIWVLSFLHPAVAGCHSSDPAAEWADSVLAQMNDTALLGQLIMVRAHSHWESEKLDQVADWVERYQLGGLCFFQGGPGRQVQLVNRYQRLAKVPLFIAMDAEWGLGMRLDSTMSFPYQMALGAIRDNDMIFEMGKRIGQDLRRVGAQINFAPVVDVNNNASNPVINFRSFGENRYEVTAKAYQYIQGLRAAGVMACAKHFPGHGDTEVDSHKGLPVLEFRQERLDSLELFPFRSLAETVPSMMVAHLEVPALDPTPAQPTTLSRTVITDLLREELGYRGLIFTDAMDMGGVTEMRASGRAEAEALAAGNDMVLLPVEPDRTMDTLLTWLRSAKLDRQQILKSVRKVLYAKYALGLHRYEPISTKSLQQDLHRKSARQLKRSLFQHAITLLSDEKGLLPLSQEKTSSLLHLQWGGSPNSDFQQVLSGEWTHTQYLRLAGNEPLSQVLSRVRPYQPKTLVVTIQGLNKYPGEGRYGLPVRTPEILKELSRRYPTIVILMGNPYVAAWLEGDFTLLCTYQDERVAQQAAAEAVLGKRPIEGKLPVTVSELFPAGTGLRIPARNSQKP
jgi:beta-glucosidase-like glycosyl hydrolase